MFQFQLHLIVSPPTDRDGNGKLKTGAAAESEPIAAEYAPTVAAAAVCASSIAEYEPPSAAAEGIAKTIAAAAAEENVADGAAGDGTAAVE